MTLLVACPVIMPPADDVLTSWNHRPHMLVVNGAVEEWDDVISPAVQTDDAFWWLFPADADWQPVNRGVAASWNYAFERARERGVAYVALVSQNLVLTEGTARLAELVDEHADWRGLLTDYAWHCIVLSVALWEQVGPFDERFWPGYFEDNDMVRRLSLAGLHTAENPMPKVGVDELPATRDDIAVTLRAGLIPESSYGENAARYAAKWGGLPGCETLTVPNEEARQ